MSSKKAGPAPMKAAIFLDLEGPIVTHRTIIAQTSRQNGEHYGGRNSSFHRFADATAIGLIANLMVRFQASVVISSILRTDRDVMDQMAHLLTRAVTHLDRDFALPIIHGITPEMKNKREDEIRAYVKQHNITRWVAIDDRRLALENFVYVDARSGFTYADYQDCKGYLADDGDDEALQPEAIYL